MPYITTNYTPKMTKLFSKLNLTKLFSKLEIITIIHQPEWPKSYSQPNAQAYKGLIGERV